MTDFRSISCVFFFFQSFCFFSFLDNVSQKSLFHADVSRNIRQYIVGIMFHVKHYLVVMYFKIGMFHVKHFPYIQNFILKFIISNIISIQYLVFYCKHVLLFCSFTDNAVNSILARSASSAINDTQFKI